MIADIKKNAVAKMGQSIAAFKNNLAKIRTGRASPGLLDSVQVEYYGSMVPLSQVANVSLLDSRTISVQPWEKNMAAKVEKAMGMHGARYLHILVPCPLGWGAASCDTIKLARLARETGMAFISAGHHATERYGVMALGDRVRQHFGIDCEFVDIDNQA